MTRRTRQRLARLSVTAALVFTGTGWRSLPAARLPHDIAQASATLVLRDGGHAELRLQVPWAEVLHAQWMPRVSMNEFLTRITSEAPEVFARRVSALQARIEPSVQVVPDAEAGQPFTQWHWPHPVELREALRRELMSRVVLPADFEHASRLTVVAERTFARDPSSVRLQLPALLGPTLLTVYRPTQQWLGAGSLSSAVAVPKAATRSP